MVSQNGIIRNNCPKGIIQLHAATTITASHTTPMAWQCDQNIFLKFWLWIFIRALAYIFSVQEGYIIPNSLTCIVNTSRIMGRGSRLLLILTFSWEIPWNLIWPLCIELLPTKLGLGWMSHYIKLSVTKSTQLLRGRQKQHFCLVIISVFIVAAY